MKKILIFSLLSVIALTGCEDRLDEVLPQDSLSPDAVFANAASAEEAALAAYSFAQSANALNGTPQLLGEWMSDNVNMVGTFPTFQEIANYNTTAGNTSTEFIYEQAYDVIGSANLMIANVGSVDDLSDVRKAELIGEAKFMRALLYLQIADLYGQPLQQGGRSNLSVQLVTDPDQTSGPQRATLGEVHDLVENDLIDAIAALNNADPSRATRGAAQALLSRLYLYQERFAEAATLANNAISNPEFSLAVDYNFYDTQSSEHFFTLLNSANEPQPAQGYCSLLNPSDQARGDAPFSQNLIDAYAEEPLDRRFANLTQVGPDATTSISIFTSKFPDGIVRSNNATVLRVTEAVCIRAEANFRNGSTIGATPLADINSLRARAGLPALAGPVTLDIILNEKRKELAFEGQRRMDLLRNGRNLRRTGMNNISESAPGQPRTILPIPTTQVDIDGLDQNDDY